MADAVRKLDRACSIFAFCLGSRATHTHVAQTLPPEMDLIDVLIVGLRSGFAQRLQQGCARFGDVDAGLV